MATTTTDLTLSVERRATTGTNASHALRSEAKVPGVLYGHGAESIAIAIDRKAFEDLLLAGGRRQMLAIALDGKRETVLIRDVQTAHIGRQVRHVDLLRVAANEEVTTTVPVVAVGTATGVKNEGGVLDVVMHDVTITGPAGDLPDHVEIDVSKLGVHGQATAADIALPASVHLDAAPETLIAAVEPSKTAEIVAADETAAVEAAAEPEVAAETPAESDATGAPADAEAKP